MKIGGRAAANLMLSGGIDAAFFVAGPHSPIIQELLRAKNVHLLSFGRADAYTRRHFYLNKFVLPQGVFDMAQNIPERDVVLIGTTANLVVKDDLHPLNVIDSMEFLLDKLKQTKTNAEFYGLRDAIKGQMFVRV